MITKFYIFETNDSDSRLPEVGDYVLLNPDEYGEIAHNSIGKIVDMIYSLRSPIIYYYVDYGKTSYKSLDGKPYNVMFELSRDQSVTTIKNYIIAWSKDRDELEMILQAKKYNL